MPMFLSFHAYLLEKIRRLLTFYPHWATLSDIGRHWATLGDTRQQYDFGIPYFCFVTREEEALLPNP